MPITVNTRTTQYKKILLRERKRHTARLIANACFADGGGGEGCIPSSLKWWVPHLLLNWGMPSSLGQGVPHPILDLGDTPYSLGWRVPWGTPFSRMGYSHLDLGWGTLLGWDTPPLSGPGMGYPHPELGWGTPLSHQDLGWGTPTQTWDGVPPLQTWEQTETITFPHPSDAGGKNVATIGDGRESIRMIMSKPWE